MSPPRPFRRFNHPDGRQWEIRLVGNTVELRITSDGDTVTRRRPFDAPVLGANDLDTLVREQLAEGFTESTPPDWKRRLDELVSFWEEDDPGFDSEVLRAQLLSGGESLAQQAIEKLTWWEEGQPRDPKLARAWFREQGDAVLSALLLGLRYPDQQVLLHVDSLLAEVPRPEIIEALLSVVEHPTPNVEDDLNRPSHMPLSALLALGKPDSETFGRLSHALDHDDFRSRDVAAAVLAESADDDLFFAVLWRKKAVARESDGMCWAMMRAAEIRRSPEFRDFLKWMQKSTRFRGPGYVERISNALAHLKNR